MFIRLAMGLLALTLVSCAKLEPESEAQPVENVAELPDQEIFGAAVRYTRDGFRRLAIAAPRIVRYDARRLLVMEGGIAVDFYDTEGRHQARMTAREGEMLELANRVWARGNVVVVSDSGMVLRTEELRYEPDLESILTESFVTIITPQDSLSGYGKSAAPDLTDWELKRTSGATWRELERRK